MSFLGFWFLVLGPIPPKVERLTQAKIVVYIDVLHLKLSNLSVAYEVSKTVVSLRQLVIYYSNYLIRVIY